MSGIKIRTLPLNTNPTPRPTTPYNRPGTAGATTTRPLTSSGQLSNWPGTFNSFDDDQNNLIFDDIITEDYILRLYPNHNLLEMKTISLIIDTSHQSLLDLGDLLPNLNELILNNSKLTSVRELGTGLRFLCSLSLNNCGLTELDGIVMLSNLKKLSARDNQIIDVNALAMHELIEELDLHGNKITDISIGDILSSCTNLKSLTLSYNPLSRAPKYRLILAAMIPQLQVLDSIPVDQNAKTKVSNGMILEAASVMQLEQEELDDERRMEMAILGDEFNTAMGYNSQYDTIKTETNNLNNLTKTQGIIPDTGSDLTHGSNVVLAGNMAIAMRRRRQNSPLNDNKQINKDKDINEYSALEVLDNALISGGLSKSKVPYYGEGDITSLVMSSSESKQLKNIKSSSLIPSSPHRSNSPKLIDKKKKTRNTSINSISFDADVIDSIDKDDINDNFDINDINYEDGSIPIFSPSIRQSNDNLRLGTSRPGSRGNNNNNNNNSNNNNYHNNNRIDSPLNLQRRTPSPNSIRSRNGLPPSSPPVQRNASRPSSSRGGLSSGIASITPSAPFKITLPVNNLLGGNNENTIGNEEDFANRLGTSQLSSRDQLNVLNTNIKEDKNIKILNIKNINKNIGVWDVSDDSSDDDDNNNNIKNNKNNLNNNNNNNHSKNSKNNQTKKYSSLANRDRVLRGNLFNEKSKDDEDDEELAIDHLSRRKMCNENVITQKTAASSNAIKLFTSKFNTNNNNNNDNNVNNIEDIQRSIKNNSNMTVNNRIQSPESFPSSKSSTLSHVAGRSLGFDLQGSLAAINQWVEDMDSEEDDDDNDEDENQNEDNDSNDSNNNEIYQNDKRKYIKDKNETKKKSSYHKIGFISDSNPAQKILSRDSILNMCIRGDDIGINSNNSLSKDEDEVANSSEAYEENDVLFFNNNIEQLPSEPINQKKYNKLNDDNINYNVEEKEVMVQKHIKQKKQQKEQKDELYQKEKQVQQKQKSQQKQVNEEILKEKKIINNNNNANNNNNNLQEITQQNLKHNVESPTKKSKVKSNPKSTTSVNEVIELPEQNIEQVNESSPSTNLPQIGNAIELSDDALVIMLSQPPKSIPQMRTKSSFQDFFRGMTEERMKRLLHRAYGNLNDLEREVKVRKRMELLSDVLSNMEN